MLFISSSDILKISSEEAFLLVPPPSQAHLVGTQERAFSVAAHRLWNSLPQEAKLAPSVLSFWKQRPFSSDRLSFKCLVDQVDSLNISFYSVLVLFMSFNMIFI